MSCQRHPKSEGDRGNPSVTPCRKRLKTESGQIDKSLFSPHRGSAFKERC